MPRIVDYSTVVERMTSEGFKSLYYNSGAFGFAGNVETISRGWIGKPDASIRPAALPLVRRVSEPFEANLASSLVQAWSGYLAGIVWAMPKSHWAFELEFGSRAWMPDELSRLGIDLKVLEPLNNAPAIEFNLADREMFGGFVTKLLLNLAQSDFQLVFPGRRTICTVHSRRQLWWTTTDSTVAAGLDSVLPVNADEGT